MVKTEKRNPRTTYIDRATVGEALAMIQHENEVAVHAVGEALGAIEAVCEALCARMARGGRLIYIGAGTSGRLGVLDAVECPPTFGVPTGLVCGVIAGGYERMVTAAEAAEDSAENGVRDLGALNVTEADTVVGISAAGGAKYVLAALKHAREAGALTVGLTCNADAPLATEADMAIVTDTGAEAITGSTRMKAGTAHKLVLNMLSTCAMVRAGHVYENLMINLRPTNEKLRRRCIFIVRDILGCTEEEAEARLARADWSIRRAVEDEA